MAKKKARKKTVSRKKTASRKKKTSRRGRSAPAELIISKSRTKASASINVSGEFYQAFDQAVRNLLATAEQRAIDNNRKTLRPQDL